MIKKHEKWIARLVVFTFVWLLQVSTMPCEAAAAGTNDRAGVASAEQGPDFYEAAKPKPAPAPKKSILPVVLLGVGVAAVAAVLILVVFKTTYDIVGTWMIHVNYDNYQDEEDRPITFSGDKKSGTTADPDWEGTGTYTVDDKKVTFTLSWSNGNTSTHTGQFDTKDKMSGRFHESHDFDGSWVAFRGASTASLPKLKNITSKKSSTAN